MRGGGLLTAKSLEEETTGEEREEGQRYTGERIAD
jgi:hypothetical protein